MHGFLLSGLSKVAGLPQMKLGWIVAPAAAIEKLEWIADTYLSVGTPVQCAAVRLLRAGESVQRQIRDRTAANLTVAHSALAEGRLQIFWRWKEAGISPCRCREYGAKKMVPGIAGS